MQHFSCDYCGTELGTANGARYTLRMEARLVCEVAEAFDSSTDDAEPIDPVDEMENWLSGSEETIDDTNPTPSPVAPLDSSYDLCAGCYRRIRADPLGLDGVRRYQFSDQ